MWYRTTLPPQLMPLFYLNSSIPSLVVVHSEGVTLTLTPDQGTTLNISQSSERSRGSKCTVCTGTGLKKSCSRAGSDYVVLLTDPKAAVNMVFTCTKPEEVFTVEVSRTGTLPLQNFNRTFIWNLKAPVPRAFHLDFTQMGLRQILPSERCPDQHTYTLLALQRTGEAAIGTYCRNGSVSGAQVLNQGRLSLEVTGGRELNPTMFNVSVGEEIKSLAVLKVTLPEGTSSSELLSPNYPNSFPDDDLMEWKFVVPPKHNATVVFLGQTQPQCLKKEPAVEYHYGNGRFAVVKKLSDPQPAQRRDSFSLILRNCEMNRIGDGSTGLSLHFKVSAKRRMLCNVDLRKEWGLSLHIEKTNLMSDCELKLNSVIQKKITVPSGKISQLSFQDCPCQELLLTAIRIIECRQWRGCQAAAAPVPLTVPVLERCLPASLGSVTWILRPPQHGTVELLPTTGNLRQSLPEQPCNGSVTLTVAEDDDGTTVGQFCPQGAIHKVQVHTNLSITASASTMGGKERWPFSHPLLNISFTREIAERYIFTVYPMKGVPTLLATPSWPVGMKSYSTVSWIVNVPSKLEAHLMFDNISQPKCSNRHTGIRVQILGSLEEMYSRREDEEAGRKITVSESFYLNMSNCMPERGDFSMLTQITLHKDKSDSLPCVKKKRQLSHQVSTYNPNGTSFLPGHNGSFPKSRKDNESHIYASIEDTLVYSHLLRDGVGIYQPFVPPSHFAPPVPNRPLSQAQQPMVDNELYGSRSNGDTPAHEDINYEITHI
uniref:CUB domain-containing protein 1 n=1 Tax=Oncorhynchus tshawytscha TaxID=74940 RepID=A0A8C8J8K8_ONCTS